MFRAVLLALQFLITLVNSRLKHQTRFRHNNRLMLIFFKKQWKMKNKMRSRDKKMQQYYLKIRLSKVKLLRKIKRIKSPNEG
jgi:hypothetical protein